MSYIYIYRSWVRIPPGAWIFVCCECRVLSGRGLCDELITRPEESYRLCCVVVCDRETSRMGAPYIYDISRQRVNRFRQSPSHPATESQFLWFIVKSFSGPALFGGGGTNPLSASLGTSKTTGAEIPGVRSPRRWPPISMGPQYIAWFLSPFWRLEF